MTEQQQQKLGDKYMNIHYSVLSFHKNTILIALKVNLKILRSTKGLVSKDNAQLKLASEGVEPWG